MAEAAVSTSGTTQAPPNTTVVQTTASPAAPTTSATTGTTSTEAGSDWTSNLSEDLKGYVANRGFKDPAMVVEGYRNLEKLRGVPEDRLIKMPEKPDDAEGWAQVFKKLGMPDKPEGYGLPKEGNDPKIVEAVQKMYFESGLTAKQAQTLDLKMSEYVNNARKERAEAQEAKSKTEDEALKKEWGAAFDQNRKTAKAAALKFGVTEEMVNKMEQSIGLSATMKFFHQVGSKLGEGDFVTGSSGQKGSSILSPNAARAKRDALMNDKSFTTRLMAKEASALAEWDQIHKWMNPEPEEN